MQPYLSAMSELFKSAAMHREIVITGKLATLLELSMQPTEQLNYWRKIRTDMFRIADSLTLQDIDDYLKTKAAT
jgi:hypothetical protein